MITLTPAQRRELKARAHHLHPVVMIGDAGLTPTVVREIDTGLKSHELIKIRVFSDDRAGRQALIDDICMRLDAAAVQHIGKILVIYRPRPEDSPAPARTDRRTGGAGTDKTAGRPRRGKQARRTKRSFQGA